jgi:hypothetical protein
MSLLFTLSSSVRANASRMVQPEPDKIPYFEGHM